MKLRGILLILGLLTLFSVILGGYFYHSAVGKAEFEKAEFQAASHMEVIKSLVNSFLVDKLKILKALSGLRELKQVLVNFNELSLNNTNLVLDNFKDSIGDCVIYVMDMQGKAISSSNRDTPESFVGKNYSFRPYFQQAANGSPFVYMALGVTSKKRGVYYSCPVYDQDKNRPVGVVVIKFPVKAIEKEITRSDFYFPGMVSMITNPQSVIFISNHKDLLYKRLWNIPEDNKIGKIAKQQQFGKESFEWAQFRLTGKNRAADQSGNKYLLYQNEIESLPGWNILHFYNFDMISKIVSTPNIRRIEHATIALCVLIGFTVLALYFMARLDIEKRINAEALLMESEEKFRSMFDQVLMGLALTETKTGRFVRVNEKYCNIVGYSKDDLYKISVMEIIHPDDRQLDSRYRERLNKGEVQNFSIEKRFIRKDNSIVWVNLTVSRLHGMDVQTNHHIAVIEDITQRKHTEDALLKSLSILDATFDATADGILVIDTKGHISTFNRKFVELWQIPGDIIELKDDALTLSFVMEQLEDSKGFLDKVNKIYSNPEMETFDELKFRDGRVFERISKPQRIKDTIVGRVWSFRDVTARFQNEAELRKLSSAVEQSPVSVVITDKEGNIEYVNPTFCNVTGYSHEEALGQNPRVLKSGYHTPDFYKELWETVLSGRVWIGDMKNKRKNGEDFWERVALAPLFNDSGIITAFVAVKEDISEQKQAEKTLKENYEVLERFRKAAVERELKMIKLKVEVNSLLSRSGQKKRYKSVV